MNEFVKGSTEHPSIGEPSVVVHGRGSGFAQEIAAGPHCLTADKPPKLLEIAKKCPVHRTLTTKIDIRSWLASISSLRDL
jgi:hypothetical protein